MNQKFIDAQIAAGWTLTDPDALQFAKLDDELPRTWHVKQLHEEIPPSNGEFHMITSMISLDDYSDEDLQEYCDSYGHELAELREQDEADMILAECIFETDELMQAEPVIEIDRIEVSE
ncbi:hypothetical protein [Vibrio owensii]|uniref:hypothetical protein n=1 Tax=Vibrio harveyi group TaxID=717610 RepID=UPI003CC57B42